MKCYFDQDRRLVRILHIRNGQTVASETREYPQPRVVVRRMYDDTSQYSEVYDRGALIASEVIEAASP